MPASFRMSRRCRRNFARFHSFRQAATPGHAIFLSPGLAAAAAATAAPCRHDGHAAAADAFFAVFRQLLTFSPHAAAMPFRCRHFDIAVFAAIFAAFLHYFSPYFRYFRYVSCRDIFHVSMPAIFGFAFFAAAAMPVFFRCFHFAAH